MFKTESTQSVTAKRQQSPLPGRTPTSTGSASADTFVRGAAALPSLSEELISLGCTVSDMDPPGPNKLEGPDLHLLVPRDPQAPADWVRLHVSRSGLGRASSALRSLLRGGPALPGAVLRGQELQLQHPAASADVAYTLFGWLYHDPQPPTVEDAAALYALAAALSGGTAPQGKWAELSDNARAMLSRPQEYGDFKKMLNQATQLGHTASADALAQMLMQMLPDKAATYIDDLPAPLRTFLLTAPSWKEKPKVRDGLLERCETETLLASTAWYTLTYARLSEKVDRLYTEPEAACVLWARLAVGAYVASRGRSRTDTQTAERSRRLAQWARAIGPLTADMIHNSIVQVSVFYASYFNVGFTGSMVYWTGDDQLWRPCSVKLPLHLGLAAAGIETALWNTLCRQRFGRPPDRPEDEPTIILWIIFVSVFMTAMFGVVPGFVIATLVGNGCDTVTCRTEKAAPAAGRVMAVLWGLMYGICAIYKYRQTVNALMKEFNPPVCLPAVRHAMRIPASGATQIMEDVLAIGRADADFHILVRAEAHDDTQWCRIPAVREQLAYASNIFREVFATESKTRETAVPLTEWKWDHPAATRDIVMQLLNVVHDHPVQPTLKDSPALLALIVFLDPPAGGPGRNGCLRELGAAAQALVDAALIHRGNAIGLLQRILDANGEVPDTLPTAVYDLTEKERRTLRSCDISYLINGTSDDNKKTRLLIEWVNRGHRLPSVEDAPGRTTLDPASLELDIFLQAVEIDLFDPAAALRELKRRTKTLQNPPPSLSERDTLRTVLEQHMRHQRLEVSCQHKILGFSA